MFLMDVDLMASDAESGANSLSESISDPSRLDSDSELDADDEGDQGLHMHSDGASASWSQPTDNPMFPRGRAAAAAMATAGVVMEAEEGDGETWVVTPAEEVQAAMLRAQAGGGGGGGGEGSGVSGSDGGSEGGSEVSSDGDTEGGSEGGAYVAAERDGDGADSLGDEHEEWVEEESEEAEAEQGVEQAEEQKATLGLFGRLFRAVVPRAVEESDSDCSRSTGVAAEEEAEEAAPEVEGGGGEVELEREGDGAATESPSETAAEATTTDEEQAAAITAEDEETGERMVVEDHAGDESGCLQRRGVGSAERRTEQEEVSSDEVVEAVGQAVEVEEKGAHPPQTPRPLAVIEEDLEEVERSLAALRLRRERMETGEEEAGEQAGSPASAVAAVRPILRPLEQVEADLQEVERSLAELARRRDLLEKEEAREGARRWRASLLSVVSLGMLGRQASDDPQKKAQHTDAPAPAAATQQSAEAADADEAAGADRTAVYETLYADCVAGH
jgi:hypothetical protein